MQILTRRQAKELGQKYYFTGDVCKNDHISKRSVSNLTCYQCQLEKSANFREKNPEYHDVYNTQYYPKNIERTQEHSKKYYNRMRSTEPELLKEQQDRNHLNYRQRNRREINARGQKWRRDNPGIANAYTAKRRAQRLNATPKWANNSRIKEIYKECEDINILTRLVGGTNMFVVDHIIPLQGKVVCGLHVEYNLQLMLAHENNVKSNKLREELL